jgi:pimeloyl-ACP methyl ester carboxylesterase
MRKLLTLLASASAVALTGCAGMVSGPDQSMHVTVQPEVAARCVLENPRGAWDLTAPSHADITSARGPMTVRCRSMNGDLAGETTVGSQLDPVTTVGAVATGGLVAGAIAVTGPAGVGAVAVAGGGVGAGLISATDDQVSGAAWKYPLEVTVQMEPVTETVGVASVSPGEPLATASTETYTHRRVTHYAVVHVRRHRVVAPACAPVPPKHPAASKSVAVAPRKGQT